MVVENPCTTKDVALSSVIAAKMDSSRLRNAIGTAGVQRRVFILERRNGIAEYSRRCGIEQPAPRSVLVNRLKEVIERQRVNSKTLGQKFVVARQRLFGGMMKS